MGTKRQTFPEGLAHVILTDGRPSGSRLSGCARVPVETTGSQPPETAANSYTLKKIRRLYSTVRIPSHTITNVIAKASDASRGTPIQLR